MSRTVPADAAAAHLNEVRGRTGTTFEVLAKRCGMDKSTLQDIAAGARPRIYRSTEANVLAVDAPPHRIDATGTHRRIRALTALGHSQAGLSVEAGYSADFLHHLLTCDTVTAAHARIVEGLYDEYHATDGAHRNSRAYAAWRAWPPADAWDDLSIDDPTARPYSRRQRSSRDDVDWVRVWYMVRGEWRGPTTLAERAAAIAELNAARDPISGLGHSAEEIAARIGMEERSVVRYRGRLDETG